MAPTQTQKATISNKSAGKSGERYIPMLPLAKMSSDRAPIYYTADGDIPIDPMGETKERKVPYLAAAA